MAAIEPTTNIGKLRLRLGDWLDCPILSQITSMTTH